MTTSQHSFAVLPARTEAAQSTGTVLLAEANPQRLAAMRTGLMAHGFTVKAVGDGMSALRCATRDVDIIVINPTLPRLAGTEVLRRLRAAGHAAPVIMLAAPLSVATTATAPGPRANAYLPAPLRFGALLTAIRAHLPAPVVTTTELCHGGLRLDLKTRHAHLGPHYSVRLSVREMALAEAFLRNPGEVLTREFLHRRVWGADHPGSAAIVDIYIGHLRGKLGANRILTHRGVGYQLLALA